MADRDEQVRKLAFAIWRDTGGAHGADREHWALAERRIASQATVAPDAIDTASAIPLPQSPVEAGAPPSRSRPAEMLVAATGAAKRLTRAGRPAKRG